MTDKHRAAINPGQDWVVWAYRYYNSWSLNLREIRRPDAVHFLYFGQASHGGVLEFGGRRENIGGDYLFVIPPGMSFHLVPAGQSRVDCIHLQIVVPDYKNLDGYAIPAKLRLDEPGFFQTILDLTVNYATEGEFATTITPLLDIAYRSYGATRVTFADHAEGRPPRDTLRHAHMHEHQIDYFIQARGRFWMDGHWEIISDGDLVYVPPEIEHAMELDPGHEYHNLSLKFVTGGPLRGLPGGLLKVAVGDANEGLREAMQKVVAAYLLHDPISEYALSGVLDPIVAVSRRDASRPRVSPIERVKQIIATNYSISLRLPWLAQHVGLRPAYLSRLFKEQVGENLSRYLRRVRVEKSQDLLRDTGLPVGEIAQRCGFGNIQYFSQIFKKVVGIAPTEFRKRSQSRE